MKLTAGFKRKMRAETFSFAGKKPLINREYKPAASGMLSNGGTIEEFKICSLL